MVWRKRGARASKVLTPEEAAERGQVCPERHRAIWSAVNKLPLVPSSLFHCSLFRPVSQQAPTYQPPQKLLRS